MIIIFWAEEKTEKRDIKIVAKYNKKKSKLIMPVMSLHTYWNYDNNIFHHYPFYSTFLMYLKPVDGQILFFFLSSFLFRARRFCDFKVYKLDIHFVSGFEMVFGALITN